MLVATSKRKWEHHVRDMAVGQYRLPLASHPQMTNVVFVGLFTCPCLLANIYQYQDSTAVLTVNRFKSSHGSAHFAPTALGTFVGGNDG